MAVIIDGSAGVTTNAGGSVNPSTNVDGINYSCRAWVTFNGTGTVAIGASGNVTSITDNGTGDYTVNFTTAMSDANYAIAVSTTGFSLTNQTRHAVIAGTQAGGATQKTTSALRIQTGDTGAALLVDMAEINTLIFR
jgi:hypothetical protein